MLLHKIVKALGTPHEKKNKLLCLGLTSLLFDKFYESEEISNDYFQSFPKGI